MNYVKLNEVRKQTRRSLQLYRVWKKRIDLILEKNKVLDLVQGKIKKPTNESSDAEKANFREIEIVAMNLIVDAV